MTTTNSAKHVPGIVQSKSSGVYRETRAQYIDLQNELHRLRSILAHDTTMAQQLTAASELFPDPIDQAAAGHEIDVALSVKLLALEKLRRVEQALTTLHTHSYGICSRCSQQIPSARLTVQPESLYCVPCLTAIEHNVDRK